MRDSASTPSRLVSDKVGNDRFLSDLWFRDQSGFLLVGTIKAHEHETVKDLQQKGDWLVRFLK